MKPHSHLWQYVSVSSISLRLMHQNHFMHDLRRTMLGISVTKKEVVKLSCVKSHLVRTDNQYLDFFTSRLKSHHFYLIMSRFTQCSVWLVICGNHGVEMYFSGQKCSRVTLYATMCRKLWQQKLFYFDWQVPAEENHSSENAIILFYLFGLVFRRRDSIFGIQSRCSIFFLLKI